MIAAPDMRQPTRNHAFVELAAPGDAQALIVEEGALAAFGSLWLRRYGTFGLRLLARSPARPKADFPGSDRCGFAQLDRWRISDSHRVHRASDRPMAIHSACTERPLHRLGRRSAPTHTGF